AARGMDALFEQLGEAAPAVLEHVVNAARELMRAAKAVVDAAEGAMDVARSGVDDEHSDPKPSAGENRTPPPGSPGPKASPGPPGIQRIDVD
ncbi:MAG: hypothetical protein JWL73_1658, partial [Actinomycetia bacterium]|nr:hypothetical protein [Actinomycetes bacterium]